MNIKYFLVLFITSSLILFNQESFSAPTVTIACMMANQDRTVSYRTISQDTNKDEYDEAFNLYRKALDNNNFNTTGAEEVEITVDRSTDTIFALIRYKDGSAGGEPLRVDGVDLV